MRPVLWVLLLLLLGGCASPENLVSGFRKTVDSIAGTGRQEVHPVTGEELEGRGLFARDALGIVPGTPTSGDVDFSLSNAELGGQTALDSGRQYTYRVLPYDSPVRLNMFALAVSDGSPPVIFALWPDGRALTGFWASGNPERSGTVRVASPATGGVQIIFDGLGISLTLPALPAPGSAGYLGGLRAFAPPPAP